MTECWFEFPDTQTQSDAISALKRGSEALGFKVMAYDAPDLGVGYQRVNVSGEFTDCDFLKEHVAAALYLGFARSSKRPDDYRLISN